MAGEDDGHGFVAQLAVGHPLAVVILGAQESREEIALPPADPYRLELENMCAAISGGAKPLLGREDAVGQAMVLDALYKSADEGRPVEL